MFGERLAGYGGLPKTLSVPQWSWLELQVSVASRGSFAQGAHYPFSMFGLLIAPGRTHVAPCLWPRSWHDGLLPVPGISPMSRLLLLGSVPLPLCALLVLASLHRLLGPHQHSRSVACVDADEPPKSLKLGKGLGSQEAYH